MRTHMGSNCTQGLWIFVALMCLAAQSLAGADNAPSLAQQTPAQGTTLAVQNGFAAAKYSGLKRHQLMFAADVIWFY